MKTLLKNGRIVTKENTCHPVDIWIEDQKVFAIGLDFAEKDFDQVIDLKGKLVMPGLVDVHVHFREPGFT